MNIILLIWGKKTPLKPDKYFRGLQLASFAAFSLGHEGNDAQKTMGIILMLLIGTGYLPPNAEIPLWVALACYTSIVLGTLLGSRKIIKTLGTGLTRLNPISGFCAQTSAALTLFEVNMAGIPLSTTHTITAAIMGVGV